MKAAVSFFVFFSVFGHAQGKSLGDCAAYLEEMRAPTFEIDAMSSLDVEIDKVLVPTLGAHLRTSFGRTRLRHVLHNPFLDRETIVDRQRAIRVLADDTLNRRKLREALGEIENSIGRSFEYDLDRIARDHGFADSENLKLVWPSLLGGSWVGAGAAIQTGLATGQILVPALFINTLMISNAADQEKERQRLRVFKPMFKVASGLAADLSRREPKILRRIGNTFGALDDADHPLGLAHAHRRLKRMRGFLGTFGGGLFLATNHGTHRARKALLEHRDELGALVSMIGELDVIVALAEFYDLNRDHLTFPKILPEEHPTHLSLVRGHHPYVWAKNRETSRANDLTLSRDGKSPRFFLLTGPNTGGKSTYLKMIGANVLLAQIGAPVFAAEMRLTPLSLFTNKHVREALDAGESSFFAQCKRVASILERAESARHVLILADEILTGTSPEEHTAIERALIEDMVQSRSLGLLATHDRKLQRLEQTMGSVRNIHVDESGREDFAIVAGPSLKRNALEVLGEAGVKSSIVEAARRFLDHPEF